MGYALMLGPCVRCHRVFPFNPVRVPSVKVKGIKEPVCSGCHRWANTERKKLGLPPFSDPHPDAYRACPEEEL